MELPRSYIEGWPALMSQEVAARYLSLDQSAFLALAARSGTAPVEVGSDVVRWRKADIDQLVKRLSKTTIPSSSSSPARPLLDSTQVERLADAISRRIERAGTAYTEKLVSINKAAAMLGIGRSTTYRLIGTGQLTVRRIGGRSLVLRQDIDRILGDEPTNPDRLT